jgi:hypothetical protein
VSDDANAIFLFPVGHPEREQRVRTLAMRPPIFQEALRSFTGGLPSDETLAATLQHQMGFTHDAVGPFIKALRASMKIAGVEEGSGGRDNSQQSNPEEGPLMSNSVTPTTTQPVQAGGRREHHSWKLGPNLWAEITISGPLGSKGLEKLQKYIELLETDEADSDEEGT